MAENQTALETPFSKEEKAPKTLKKKLTTALIAILAIGVIVGTIAIGIHYVQLAEGTVELPEDVASLTPCPENPEDTVAYLKKLYEAVNDPAKAKVVVSGDVSIDNSSLLVSKGESGEDTDGLKPVLLEMKDSVLGKLRKDYYALESEGDIKKIAADEEKQKTEGKDYTPNPKIGRFGGTLEGLMPPADFSAENLTDATCNVGYMKFNEDLQQDQLVEEDYHYIDLVFKNEAYPFAENSVLYRNFDVKDVDAVFAALQADIAKNVIVNSSEITCNGFKLNARANRFTDEIDYAEYTRCYKVKLVVSFLGEFQGFGRQTISFDYNVKQKYDFTFAGIRFEDKALTVEKGDEKEIKNFLGVEAYDDPGNVEITWVSSDESIATVTNNGYVFGVQASATPVTVTATVKYLGNTYVQTCQVTVVKAVEKVLVSERKLQMKPGDTANLTCEISPEDATIKDVLWFTMDESVAKVDENGVVTAVGSGNTVVYVVTVNEHYKSSCQITVQ